MIVPKGNFKKFSHVSPLFSKCQKAQLFSTSPDSTWYIVLPEPSDSYEAYPNSEYICKCLHNQNEQCCFIAIEGQCFHEYLLAKKKNKFFPLMTEQQIFNLISCMVSAFVHLKRNGLEYSMTNLKQYSIRRVPGPIISYKLIYHKSMISQMDAARSGVIQWSDLYLSPEELDGDFICQKSIVFSFGLMLLNICSSEDAKQNVYLLDQFKINWPLMTQKLKRLQQKQGYSKLLCNFIEQCLLANYKDRPDFEELQAIFKRKKDRIFHRQSQFLTLISKFQKKGSITYDLILPNSYQLGISQQQMSHLPDKKQFQSQGGKTKQKSPEKQVNTTQALKSEGCEESQKKMRKKSSLKFEGSKVSKNKVQVQQISQSIDLNKNNFVNNNAQIQRMYDHFQYRGTFGQHNLERSLKTHQQDTTKKVKKSMLRENSQDEAQNDDQISTKKQNKQENGKQSKKIQSHLNKDLLNQFNDSSLKLQQTNVFNSNLGKVINVDQMYSSSNAKVQKMTIEISCQNGTHHIRQSEREQNANIETPKGFGRFGFPCDTQNIHASPEYRRKVSTQAQNLKLIDRMQVLSLQECLRPIEQIIKKIDRVGVWVQGDLYYGDFLAGRRDGLGLQLFPNDEYYYGHFKQDLFSGEGFYFWNSRQYYFGQFELGQKLWGRLQGQVQYQGSFKDNRRNGFGTCYYSNGEVYSGTWKNGKKHGYGIMKEPDGSIFAGNWTKGKRSGEGYFETGQMTIAGNWNEEVIEGQALIKYSNGDVFKGKTGPILEKIYGEYISKSGRIFKGEFENDLPKRGELIYSNGDRYVGELDNMRRHGYGEYYYSSGETYKGFWQNNSKMS